MAGPPCDGDLASQHLRPPTALGNESQRFAYVEGRDFPDWDMITPGRLRGA